MGPGCCADAGNRSDPVFCAPAVWTGALGGPYHLQHGQRNGVADDDQDIHGHSHQAAHHDSNLDIYPQAIRDSDVYDYPLSHAVADPDLHTVSFRHTSRPGALHLC